MTPATKDKLRKLIGELEDAARMIRKDRASTEAADAEDFNAAERAALKKYGKATAMIMKIHRTGGHRAMASASFQKS